MIWENLSGKTSASRWLALEMRHFHLARYVWEKEGMIYEEGEVQEKEQEQERESKQEEQQGEEHSYLLEIERQDGLPLVSS